MAEIFGYLRKKLYLCTMSKRMGYEEFVEKAAEFHMGKYEYNEKTREWFNGSHSKIPIICPIHGEFWQIARSHLKYGCERCSYENRGKSSRSSTNEFIEKARRVHGEKYDYSKTNYITAKKDKVCIICSEHGEFWQLPNDHLSGKGCPRCNDSHLEREIIKTLTENGISFEVGKHFDWLGKMHLDFYLPKHNTAIECQGKQHFGIGGWSERFDFNNLFNLDEKKNNLCKENHIKLLYFMESIFINRALELKLYNKENSFTNKSTLVEKIML